MNVAASEDDEGMAAGMLVPMPGIRVPDRLTVGDRVAIHPATHVFMAVAGIALGWSQGWGALGGAVVALGTTFLSLAGRNVLIQKHFRNGQYRRVLAMARELERRPIISSEVPTWRILEGECQLMLGRLDEARTCFQSAWTSDEISMMQSVRRIDLAVLDCHLGDGRRALEELARIDVDRIAASLRPHHHLVKAVAHYWVEEIAECRSQLEMMSREQLHPALEAGRRGLQALILLERDGEPQRARIRSRQAIEALGGVRHSRPCLLVQHAYILLETSGEIDECLEIVHAVLDRDHELGPTGSALLHYVLARCFLESGLSGEAQRERDLATGLPMSGPLRDRLRTLSLRMSRLPLGAAHLSPAPAR